MRRIERKEGERQLGGGDREVVMRRAGRERSREEEEGEREVVRMMRMGKKTAIQCKTKDLSCHRQSSVRDLSGIRAAQSSVFCVIFL